MASQTDIVNMALAKLGHSPLQSLDLDESEVAVAARALYTLTLDDMFSLHPWNFCHVRISLPELAFTQVGARWTFAYQMPPDALRVYTVEPKGVEYEVSGRVILTNQAAPLIMTYMKRELDSSLYPPAFTMALVYRMAMELSTSVSAKDDHTGNFTQQYFAKLQEAKTLDGLEEGPIYEDHNPLADQRRWFAEGRI